MEVIIPILAATGLIYASSDKKDNNSNKKMQEQQQRAKKEAFTNMGQGRVNPQNYIPNTQTPVTNTANELSKCSRNYQR